MSEMDSLIFLAIGAVIGFIISRLFRKPIVNEQNLQKKLQESQDELDSYRQQVSEHFSTSARLFDDMTQKYQQIYEHMANQSKTLADSSQAMPSLFNSVDKTASAPEEEVTSEDAAPKDYTDKPSGLLQDPKEEAKK